jgi:hypothetical protein
MQLESKELGFKIRPAKAIAAALLSAADFLKKT